MLGLSRVCLSCLDSAGQADFKSRIKLFKFKEFYSFYHVLSCALVNHPVLAGAANANDETKTDQAECKCPKQRS